MQQPEIKLKKIEVHLTNSEETPCYSADVYVDGKKFAQVKNAGHGGADDVYLYADDGKSFRPGWKEVEALDERIGATFPEEDVCGKSYKQNLEGICHAAVWTWVEQRDLRRMMSRKVLVRREGKIYELKPKKTRALIDAAVVKYGRGNVLNVLPFDDAFRAFAATA